MKSPVLSRDELSLQRPSRIKTPNLSRRASRMKTPGPPKKEKILSLKDFKDKDTLPCRGSWHKGPEAHPGTPPGVLGPTNCCNSAARSRPCCPWHWHCQTQSCLPPNSSPGIPQLSVGKDGADAALGAQAAQYKQDVVSGDGQEVSGGPICCPNCRFIPQCAVPIHTLWREISISLF